jgi:hypothetical protein
MSPSRTRHQSKILTVDCVLRRSQPAGKKRRENRLNGLVMAGIVSTVPENSLFNGMTRAVSFSPSELKRKRPLPKDVKMAAIHWHMAVK